MLHGKSEIFRLNYFAPENRYDEYICEMCMGRLNPKLWYYHCVFADQFTHTWCMIERGADSNIKYGKSYMIKEVHKHELTMISCTYDCSPCNKCRDPMRTGLTASVGLECVPCNFKVHLECLANFLDDDDEERELS